MRCTFGDGDAVAFVALSAGCLAFPEHRTQALCLYHYDRSTPLGEFHVIKELEPATLAWYRGTLSASTHRPRQPFDWLRAACCDLPPYICDRPECTDDPVHDACLGHIEGATWACCGHGRTRRYVLPGDEEALLAALGGGAA